MIQKMGEVITAALHLKTLGQTLEADKSLTNALHTIMPDHADLIEMVDAKTALTLLGDSKLVEAYAEILLVRAEMKIALDNLSEGEALQARAIRIMIRCIQNERHLSPKAQLIWGRLSGLDLHLLLEKSEFEQWVDLDKAIQKGLIIAP